MIAALAAVVWLAVATPLALTIGLVIRAADEHEQSQR